MEHTVPLPLSPLPVDGALDLLLLGHALALHAPVAGAAAGAVGPRHVLGAATVLLSGGSGAPQSTARGL